MEHEEQKYAALFAKIQGTGPTVLVNACTHGHETVGLGVIEALQTLTPQMGTLIYNVANERAVAAKTAFTESDLNRVFPGSPTGTYEERLAHLMHPVLAQCDVVIDVHSTNTTEPGADSMLIVTKLDARTKTVVDAIAPPKVLVMEYKNKHALISDAAIGIAFEYGSNNNPVTLEWIVRDIKKVLMHLDMIPREPYVATAQRTEYYRVFDALQRTSEMTINSAIKNYTLVTKGQRIGTNAGEPMFAPQDFVPILFGENRYKNIFGFMATAMSQ